jgi:hypothetical protein
MDNRDVKSSRVTGTRERVDETIQIRKNKRLAELKRRRQTKAQQHEQQAATLPVAGQLQAPHAQVPIQTNGAATIAGGVGGATIDLRFLDLYVQGVAHGDEATQLDCTRKIRKLLSKEDNPPAMEIINKGLVPVLVNFLTRVNNHKLQFEAAWALTNIASTEHTSFITYDKPPLSQNAVPFLAQLMRSPSADVREQSCWCLGNVAGDGSNLRDIVLTTKDCLSNLILNISMAQNESMLKNATWALSNFCRGKPQPAIHIIKPALKILGKLINCEFDEVLRDACWALSYISDGDDNRIQAVLDEKPVHRLVELLGHSKSAVITPALRSLGNIISGNDSQTQYALDCNALQALVPLLDSQKDNIKKEACWTLSNIAAGTIEQARRLVNTTDANGFPVIAKVIDLASGGPYDVRKEAAWVLANVCTGGDVNNIRALVDSQPVSAIHALVNLLQMDDAKMLLIGLEAIEAILGRGEPRPGQDYMFMIQEHNGVAFLENLGDNEDEDIYQKSHNILQTYFAGDSDFSDDSDGDFDGDGFVNFTAQ